MSDLETLQRLSSQMHLEPDGGGPPSPDTPVETGLRSLRVSTARVTGGKGIRLLKTLLSSHCKNSCRYCPFQSGRDYRRAAFTPADFAGLANSLAAAGAVEGIFLSSGVRETPVKTQDQLLETAHILRRVHNYRGYLHLKIMPGAEQDQVYQAMLLADRLSVNLEAPTSAALARLAPEKAFQQDLITPLRWIEEFRQQRPAQRAWNGRWPSSTTQFVVGPGKETDLDLLAATSKLQQQAGLQRAYYSSFTPIPGTSLETEPPSPTSREQRLYQASFLLRDYGFDLEELPFNPDGSLPAETDPKQAWADAHLRHQPLEINTAPREALLRVPGIGPRSAEKILRERRLGSLSNPAQLAALGISRARCLPYLTLNGRRPARQPALF
jgi:predicted DNA-binding helix-hairpin-helix protein